MSLILLYTKTCSLLRGGIWYLTEQSPSACESCPAGGLGKFNFLFMLTKVQKPQGQLGDP